MRGIVRTSSSADHFVTTHDRSVGDGIDTCFGALPPPNAVPSRFQISHFNNIFKRLTTPRRIVHNHPSGDPTPSTADIDMTRQVVDAGRTLKITVHDHLVVGREGVASFKALGLLR
jgi:hypothetical protein